jgi:hypothetical protein
MALQRDTNDDGDSPPLTTLGAGAAGSFRVEFTPTSRDRRFGVFQLYVAGVPIGDGTTTAVYPHYQDLCRLCRLAEEQGVREREPLWLGDTFDHLLMYLELTKRDVVFTFTGRPISEWGDLPPLAPPAGKWMQLDVARSEFVSTWRQAEPLFKSLLAQ